MTAIYGKDFAAIYNEKWAFWGPKTWPFLERIVRKTNPSASTWLDLCCGTGSLLTLASENGFAVTGVDASPHQLRHARFNVSGGRFVCEDIRSLSVPGRFDVITCMFDSLNYLTAKPDLGRVFRRVRNHLADEGIFAFDMNTLDGLRNGWRGTTVTHDRRTTLIVELSFDPKGARGRFFITGFIKDGRLHRCFQEEHLERGYTAPEIESPLLRAGFDFKKYDGHSLGRPRKKSARLLYVCRVKRAVRRPARGDAGRGVRDVRRQGERGGAR